MKKVVLFFVAGAALCLASCCGSKCDKAACEAAKADSIRIADSIAKADSAAAAVAAAASPSLGVSGSVVGIALIFSLACDIILASFSAALLLIRFSIAVDILR